MIGATRTAGRARAPLLFALAISLALSCRPPATPNLLLISIDALRADRLGCYGHDAPTSPFLDELAASGTLFANAFVNTHGTTPSHTTMLSGLYQETHRVGYARPGAAEPRTRIPEQVEMVQELLTRHGYATLAVTDGGNIGRAFGFARGFDEFDDRGGGVRRGAQRLLKGLRKIERGRPIFALFHTYEVHSPYTPPRELLSRFTDIDSTLVPSSELLLTYADDTSRLEPRDLAFISHSYDAGIRFTDDHLRRLFEELRAIGFLEHAVVVITSDHGEELGEHGGLLHRSLLYEELLHVPLIVVGANVDAGRVIAEPVSTVDIVPTLLALASLKPASALPGRNLLREELETRPVFAQYGGLRFAVRNRRFKLIKSVEPAAVELYDLETDPGERRQVAEQRPHLTARLLRRLNRWRRSQTPIEVDPQPIELDERQRQRLEALGYL